MSEFISYSQQSDESSFIPHRPTAKVEPAEFETVYFWTLATLGKHLANVPSHLVPGYFSWNVNLIQGTSGAGKRGPGNHIWDLKYKPEVLTEESAMDLDDDSNPFADDEDEAMVVSA